MSIKTLLITPPFTQLNTPYPATAYLKGFLDEQGVAVNQCDLSIGLFNKVFTSDFIARVFLEAEEFESFEFLLVWENRAEYIEKVDEVTAFLRVQTLDVAQQLLTEGYFPKAHRSVKPLDSAYHQLDEIDKAKHLGTLFIEELGDFISANVDEFFSFTRYAERIATSASSFDEIDNYLGYSTTIIEDQLLLLLVNKIEEDQPDLVCFTIPFPGNLFAALRCAQFLKKNYKRIKIAFGGGYCNTELRSLTDPRIFKYIDFITLDDGEGPLLKLIQHLSGGINQEELERTFLLDNGKVVYQNRTPNTIYHHSTLPAPSYKGLDFSNYMSFLDVINPMHRLWTDGRWNKLTISHGCYWKQCSFCDVNLDYIGNYQNTTAVDLVDKIEKVRAETGVDGFHFVDEAAPPKILKALAEELIKRKVTITWWTNIRFEKTFTDELCELLAKSGCIAVTGGLEVASDRLLAKMKKGVDIAQVARVTNSFAQYNIMVHAYLMYGFPTETEQETIDSLEIVRQLFENNCIQSAFWHQFTTTIHSPIGKNPEEFDIKITGPKFKGFAQNDLTHKDPKGAKHQNYTKGLNKALNSYLNGNGFDVKLEEWFGFGILGTTLPKTLVKGFLS
ncbi:MAG: radical SAM protein [Flavobacteriales bacterium]|nr:radical SAM protein [Flavobacteriales bacterium]